MDKYIPTLEASGDSCARHAQALAPARVIVICHQLDAGGTVALAPAICTMSAHAFSAEATVQKPREGFTLANALPGGVRARAIVAHVDLARVIAALLLLVRVGALLVAAGA